VTALDRSGDTLTYPKKKKTGRFSLKFAIEDIRHIWLQCRGIKLENKYSIGCFLE
jgi:hypothetical protein